MSSPELARLHRVRQLRELKRDEAAQRYAAAQTQWRQLHAQMEELGTLAAEYNAQFHARTAAAASVTQELQGMQRFYAQVARLRDQQRGVVERAAVARDHAHRALTLAQTELLAMETLASKRAVAHKKAEEKKADRGRIPPRPRSLV